MRKSTKILSTILFATTLFFFSCTPTNIEGSWDFELFLNEDEPSYGVLKITNENGAHSAILNSFQMGKLELQNFKVSGSSISGNFEKWGDTFSLEGKFTSDSFKGKLKVEDEIHSINAKRQSEELVTIDRSQIKYVLSDNDLEETELNIDHAKLLEDSGQESFQRGERIYNSNCINCHGNPEIEGSIPLALKFWEQPFKAGKDPYSIYETISRGYATMPPQLKLNPREKYDVITYIREAYVRKNNTNQYFNTSIGYLAGLPEGTSTGPESKPYNPWSDQDYGNFFINTYELVDSETGLERFHSPGPTPYPDEDYSKNNFAYKGIAVRLDEGDGGVAKGKAWMIFDHDLMRVAGGWTGEGFIDWNAILLNDRHETYPRTIGKLHFETPVGAGWANPETGSFEDQRFKARDGRKFGPLPKEWADYKGLYHHDDNIIISYSVGKAEILEQLGMEKNGEQTVFTRTLNISPSSSLLKLRVAKESINVQISGNGATLAKENGYVMMTVKKAQAAKVRLYISDSTSDLKAVLKNSAAPMSLQKFTQGGQAHYPEELTSVITKGSDDNLFAVDQLSPPYNNPWNCRMKLSGIDFMKDGNRAVACTTDGDVWLITGLTDGGNSLKWKRIGAGLFQPLGIKVIDEQIFVTCRDQLVRLRDFNGDDETDFYESFNHDHQVTDHFHEFAMGLQADEVGNLYYAKSGRHAREALIPQHGTLIKVSKDGSKSEIIAKGFRAANGVCINPDGSFLVTDQQGYWNPMNRINWIETDADPKFYGNMWGYNPPKDSTRLAMEQPMVWVDMEFDRSPSELLWVDSEKWGALNGSLLSLSYGYGKIQLVLNEEVDGQRQGGVIDIPGIKFYTGVMRGRFNPDDQQLYLCGMEAWATSQTMRTGDLYRIRCTGKTVPMPIELNALENGIQLTFASKLDAEIATNNANYEVKTWDLIRSSKYGSDRHNVKTLKISDARLTEDGKGITLLTNGIVPVDVMTISYNISDESGAPLEGTVQNTIHALGKDANGKKSVAMVLPKR